MPEEITAAMDLTKDVDRFMSSQYPAKVPGIREVLEAYAKQQKYPWEVERLLRFYALGATQRTHAQEEEGDQAMAKGWPNVGILEWYPQYRRLRVEAQLLTGLRAAPDYRLPSPLPEWGLPPEEEKAYQERREQRTRERREKERQQYREHAQTYAAWFAETYLSGEYPPIQEDIQKIVYKALRLPSAALCLPQSELDAYLAKRPDIAGLNPDNVPYERVAELALEWTMRECHKLGYHPTMAYQARVGVVLLERGKDRAVLQQKYHVPEPPTPFVAGGWDLLSWTYVEGTELAIGLVGHAPEGEYSVVAVWEPREYAYLQYASPFEVLDVYQYPLPLF